jgi:hypothetical protein
VRVLGEDARLLAAAGCDVEALRALEAEIAGDGPAQGAGTWRDAHVHLGRDRDGHVFDAEGLVADLDANGIADAVCFPPDDPGPDGQFAAANAAVLAAARRRPGRIVPFCRVDPERPGAARAMDRAQAGGAAGLKLHPVAQGFRPESAECVAVVRDAAARGWPVLLHAGFGARRLAGPMSALADAAPDARLILAHGGRGDAAALEQAMRGRERVVFDTSLATLPDLVAIGPERLVFGSDRPYGEHATARQLVGLAARVADWDAGRVAAVMGANLTRVLGR